MVVRNQLDLRGGCTDFDNFWIFGNFKVRTQKKVGGLLGVGELQTFQNLTSKFGIPTKLGVESICEHPQSWCRFLEGLEFPKYKKSPEFFLRPDLEVSKNSKIIKIG